MFSSTKEDKKRIEKALEESGLSFNKNDTLDPAKFEFEHFFTFYKNLTCRTEVENVFNTLCGDNCNKKVMSTDQFVEFVNKVQRDPRLNEILHPYANAARARDLILEYEPDEDNAQNGLLSCDGFLRYLMSEDNPIVSSTKLELNDDMDQPLAHYFINSSHNTYLTGHQLTGKSSVEMYRQCLLAGCRCVELDFWNGKTDEPVIVHGYTLVPDISAREVIEAIAESAFKTSDYPVILSFENHCNPKQQAKIAQYCREYFGDKLLDIPIDSFKLEPDCSLPPPSMLKNKIIIKNKKKHRHYRKGKKKSAEHETPTSSGNGEVFSENAEHRKSVTMASMRQGSKDSSQDDEEDEDEASSTGPEDDDDENTPAEDIKIQMQGKPSEKVSCRKETEAGAEISALVNYVQPVHFVSFEYAQRKRRYYEMSSFDEKQAMALLREQPIEFVNYNKCQLSRVYPAGIRIDSSNFMPIKFWNAGCQLVAINYQNLDVAMQLNLGIFEYNARCGYILKPECLRRRDRCFDPFAESPVDGIVAGTVSIHVLSGQFLFTDKKVGIYVDVEMYGLPADTVRKRFRSRPLSSNNNLNPVFTNEEFIFTKVVLPDLAAIRIAAYDDSQRLIGHRILPVTGLCPGYRHVTLRNESGQALPLATLFLNIVVKDFVPDGLSAFAEALANPIKFQSEQERRSTQLAVFMDDIEYDINTEPVKPENHLDPRNSMPTPSPRVRPKPRTPAGSVQSDPLESTDPNAPLPSSSTVLPSSPSLDNVLVAESVEKLLENKLVKEKKMELEKKLKTLHKKCDKEKNRLLVQIAAHDTEKSRLKCMPQITTKLVKRMSFKNAEGIGSSLSTLQVTPDGSDLRETEHTLTNPKSEKLLAVSKECITQERDIQEEYHELIYSSLDKIMKTSQSNQLKTLRVLLEKETDAVMRRLETDRKEKVKSLAKKHKDKDEMIRVKRELATAMVERGVNERMRLTELYEKRKEELEKQHEQIRQQIRMQKTQAQADIFKEFEAKMKSVMGENGHAITEQ